MKAAILLLCALFTANPGAAEIRGDFVVTDHGAKGNGRDLDTAAIQAAIDACHESGGGTVRFPTGRFLAGTIVLKSKVTLHLSPGAVLLASANPGDYSMKHLIFARDAEHIGIEGGGVIDGQSDEFFEPSRDNDSHDGSGTVVAAGKKPKEWRPSPLIELVGCRDVRVESVTIRMAPAWTLRPKNCDGVKIRGLSILNDLRAINSDGIDIDSSRNVIVSDCNIVAGDDCIVLKTTNWAGHASPTENVVVTNCVLESSASALKLGTESLGDFRHIVFSNCVIRNSRTGIALMAKDGGTMESVHFSNISITTKPKWNQGYEWPIHIDSEQRRDDSKLSTIRDVTLSNIRIESRGRIIMQGQKGAPIEGLVLRDVTLRVTGHEDIAKAKKISGGSRYTDNVLDLGAKPAALICGYINDLRLDGVRVFWPEGNAKQPRHAVYGLALQRADFDGLQATASQRGMETILLESEEQFKR